MRHFPPLAAIVLATLLTAAEARAETSFHLAARVGLFDPTGAADTFDAVYGGDRFTLVGLQAEVRFARGWYLALAAERGALDGELVAILPGGEVVPTGTPTEMTLTPVHLTVGWAFRPGARWGAFVGGGPTLLDWEEENAVAPVSGSDAGVHAVGGLRWSAGRWEVGAELRYSAVPDALGEGGVSAAFGEDDLGGVAVGLLAGLRLGG